mmetsp:Transcript_19112/g.31982  ORF Transcript_19112/g.31982 Transcript_19112/m.31982 type:complete len:202 (-) Transcript_19112:456-1061(-)
MVIHIRTVKGPGQRQLSFKQESSGNILPHSGIYHLQASMCRYFTHIIDGCVVVTYQPLNGLHGDDPLRIELQSAIVDICRMLDCEANVVIHLQHSGYTNRLVIQCSYRNWYWMHKHLYHGHIVHVGGLRHKSTLLHLNNLHFTFSCSLLIVADCFEEARKDGVHVVDNVILILPLLICQWHYTWRHGTLHKLIPIIFQKGV